MATKAFTGKGVILSIGTPGAGETFTPIAQLSNLTLPSVKITYEDITNLSSPSGNGATVLQEFLPTVTNPGELTATGKFLPSDAGYAALMAAWNSGAVADFKVQLPKSPDQTTTGNLYAFSGYIQEQPLPDAIDVTKAITFKLSVKLTTVVTPTPGT